MKSFFIFGIIVLSLIFIVGNTTLYGADIGTGSSVNKLMVNLEKKTEKLSIPERKIYYQNTIDTLEERIFQYRKLQEILRSRMDGMNSLLPGTITGAVIDKQDFGFIGRTGKLFEFQAKQCTILEGKSTCASLLSINADEGRIFTLKNVTRGVTSKNLITQNSYHAIAGWDHPIYSFVDDNEVNANILQYGENKLELIENGVGVGKTITEASCIKGTQWKEKTCIKTDTSGATRLPQNDVIIDPNSTTTPGTCESVYGRNNSICASGFPVMKVNPIVLTSYVTKEGEKAYSGGIIQYSSLNDEYLSLKGVGPQGPILIRASKQVETHTSNRTSTIKGNGTWVFWNINSDNFLVDGLHTYTIWDGKNEYSKINIQIQSVIDDPRYSPIERPRYNGGGRSGRITNYE